MLDARDLVNDRYTRILRPSDNAPIYVWARQIKLDSTSPIAGSYRIENSMWLKPLYDAYQSDDTRMLTVLGPNQGGRTKLMEVCSLWAAKHRPGPMQWNTITDKRAKDFAEERWWPMAKSCEDILAKLPAGGVSEGKNRHQERIQKVIFTDGMPFIVQGCTESNLEEKSIMTQFNDECFQWPTGRLEYAWIRCNVAYAWNYKVINGSAAGVDGDDIHETFKSGTQEELHWHCLKCGFPHVPMWGEVGKRGGIKWETNSATKPGGNDWDYDEVKKTVRYECPNCNEGVYEDASRIRRQLNETIEYIAQNPEAAKWHRSFRFNILPVNWPGLTWGRWVEEFLKADKAFRVIRNLEPLRTFWTRRMTEPWEESKFAQGKRRVVLSDYKLGTPNIYLTTQWEREKTRFFSVDKQESGYWFVARACGEGGASRLIDRGSLDSYAEIEARRIDLGVKAQCVLLDFGYEINECASAAIKYGWTGMRGVDRDGLFIHFKDILENGIPVKRKVQLPYSEAKYKDPMMGTSEQVLNRRFQLVRRQEKKLARYYDWINLPIKNLLAAFMAGEAIPWEIPEDAGPEYIRQINSEVRHYVINAKGVKTEWWSNSNAKGTGTKKPNHMRDCECQIIVAMCLQQMIDLTSWNPDENSKVSTSIRLSETETA